MAQTVDQKLLKRTKFPPEFDQKVDMRKVNVDVMKKWVGGKIQALLKHDDEVLVELIYNFLDPTKTTSPFPKIKEIQIQLTGFLDKDASSFCKELWGLCLSAQVSPQGVPKELLEAKKLEMIQEKNRQEKAAEEARKRKEEERTRERDVDTIRQRERSERGRGRGRGGFRGGSGRDFDRRRNLSRSPPRYRRRSDDRGPPPRRDMDTYMPPSSRGSNYDDVRRPRSPSPNHSASRSRSPPRRRRDYSPAFSRSRSRSRGPPRHYRARYHDTTRRGSSPRGYDRYRDNKDSRAKTRSTSPVNKSRSPSPRRSRERRSRSRSTFDNDRSPSPLPPSRKAKYRRKYTSSPGRSATRSRSPVSKSGRHSYRSRSRSIPALSEEEFKRSHTDIGKGHHNRRKRSPTRSRSRNRNRSFTPPRQRKRVPSVERYEPHQKRRREISSTHHDDVSALKPAGSPDTQNSKMEIDKPEEEIPNKKFTTSELREKLLKQKLIALRRASQEAVSTKMNTKPTTQ